MFPSPNELLYFVEVANTRNISRAAERLGITQPTLSLAVRRLEDSFGLPLLIRSKSGVQLTKSGEKLVFQARDLLDSWEKIRSDSIKDEQTIGGMYSIGCHVSVALYSLGFLPSLLGENPGLEIKLKHDLSRKIAERVISFNIDFGIVVNPTRHPDLVIRPLVRDEVTFWTAKNPTKQQDLSTGEALLVCDPELTQTQVLLKQLAKKKARYSRIINTGSLEVASSLVAEGVGVGILPGKVAQRYESFELQRLENMPKFHDRICLVYRADAQKSVTARYIARAIERSFKDQLLDDKKTLVH